MDKLHQSIKEVESAIVEKQDLIEDLNQRVKSIRLSTPGGRRSLGPTTTSRPSMSTNTRPSKATAFQIPSDVTAEVERQMDQMEKPTFIPKVARATRVSKNASTVSVGKLGMPGKIDISAFIRDDKKDVSVKKEEPESVSESSIAPHVKDERPKPGSSSSAADVKSDRSSTDKPTQPSFPSSFNLTPAPSSGTGSTPSTSAFGAMKFSLDPGDLSSAHTRSRTAISGTSRAHHAAPRLSASPASSPSASTPPAISFFAPPKSGSGEADSASGKAGPKGFVSFSGFGQK